MKDVFAQWRKAIKRIVQGSSKEKASAQTFTLSKDMSIKDIESLYLGMTLKQEFYNEEYGKDWRNEPYRQMAKLIKQILKPLKHVDIGCGKGLLVEAMRAREVESYGIDFSAALINCAQPNVQKYLQVAPSEDVLKDVLLQSYDLISYMEVFEHIPVPILDKTLHALSEYTGTLFLTIPSYGFDPTFSKGLSIDSEEWQRDMIVNIPFKNIILENGKPHCGHITLASYRWWTEFFLFHGFLRNIDLETECLSLFNETLTQYRWEPYILQKIKSGNHPVSTKEADYLGRGWHAYEPSSEARWTDGQAVVYCKWEGSEFPKNIRILCLAPEVSISMESSLIVTIDRLDMDDQYRLQWLPVAGSQPQELINRGKWAEINVSLELYKVPTNHGTIRIKLISDNFCPQKIGLSSDSRNLGMFVRSMELFA